MQIRGATSLADVPFWRKPNERLTAQILSQEGLFLKSILVVYEHIWSLFSMGWSVACRLLNEQGGGDISEDNRWVLFCYILSHQIRIGMMICALTGCMIRLLDLLDPSQA
jgi:hypothetical protein